MLATISYQGNKQAVLDMKATLDDADVVEQNAALCPAPGIGMRIDNRFPSDA